MNLRPKMLPNSGHQPPKATNPPVESHLLEGLMDPATCAAYLHLSPLTLSDWRVRGIGPPFLKLCGGAIRYPVTPLKAWLASCAVGQGR
jgi:hypothetical protein